MMVVLPYRCTEKRLLGELIIFGASLPGWWEHFSSLPAWLGGFAQDSERLIFSLQALMNNLCWMKYRAPTGLSHLIPPWCQVGKALGMVHFRSL